jgi:hypothetical protein
MSLCPALLWNLPFCPLLSRICPCILSYCGISPSVHFCSRICSCILSNFFGISPSIHFCSGSCLFILPYKESPLYPLLEGNMSLYHVLTCTKSTLLSTLQLNQSCILSYNGISPFVFFCSGVCPLSHSEISLAEHFCIGICPFILSYSGISPSVHFCIGICPCLAVESSILST